MELIVFGGTPALLTNINMHTWACSYLPTPPSNKKIPPEKTTSYNGSIKMFLLIYSYATIKTYSANFIVKSLKAHPLQALQSFSMQHFIVAHKLIQKINCTLKTFGAFAFGAADRVSVGS